MPAGVPNRRLLISRLPRSSLAEVLIHHGIPAVLGMREIADLQTFAQALRSRCRLIKLWRSLAATVVLYKFNYPAWTLPVLYLHPDFDGNLSWMRTSRNYQEIPCLTK